MIKPFNMASGSNIYILYVTADGRGLAGKIAGRYPHAQVRRYTRGIVKQVWQGACALVFIMAAGIAVRSIAAFVRDKRKDPAVLVLDEKGRYVVSLLGGHEAGANTLCRQISDLLGAEAVITTGTDANRLTSVDVFAAEHHLILEPRNMLPRVSAQHIRDGKLKIYSDIKIDLPEDYEPVSGPDEAQVVISHRTYDRKALFLRPRHLVVGMGMNSGTQPDEIKSALAAFLKNHGFSRSAVRLIATHEKKAYTEKGLKEFAAAESLRVLGFSTAELNSVRGVTESKHARKALGVTAVAEPAALLAAHTEKLLVSKVKSGNLTLALAESPDRVIYVVGTGPGKTEFMSQDALRVIGQSDVVVGYRSYLKLIFHLVSGKQVVGSAMTQEVQRARAAVQQALAGKRVAVISGGDPGVYAMAGLVFEIVRTRNAGLDVEVIPGISALNACAARLGAPLMHDFAAISLSDRLTPWQQIEKRLEAAGQADFVIVLYNPRSKGRKSQIVRARQILLSFRSGGTPVGIVRAAMREGEEVVLTDLEHMLDYPIDMTSTVIIGNSNSYRWRAKMITPRGYEKKYEL